MFRHHNDSFPATNRTGAPFLVVLAFLHSGAHAEESDRHDAVMLLDNRLVLVRMHVSLDGHSLESARAAYIKRLVKALDTDSDGKLIRREIVRSPFVSASGQPQGNSGFLDVFRNTQPVEAAEVVRLVESIGGKTIGFQDERSGADEDAAVFAFLDTDNSKTLDAAEIAAARERIVAKDIDHDACIGRREFGVTVERPDPAELLNHAPREPTATSNAVLDLAAQATHQQIVSKFDRDKNGSLGATELGWPPERITALDTSGNKLLEVPELQGLRNCPPDVEVVVRLGDRPNNLGSISVNSTTARLASADAKKGHVRIVWPEADCEWNCDATNPVQRAESDAVALIDRLDADRNGYLEPQEIGFELGGGRVTFASMDSDGDHRVFRSELLHYASMLAQPAATSLRVIVHDDGNGVFDGLDVNRDGRISQREIKQSAKSLASLDRDGLPGIRANEPQRKLSIEFARGQFNGIPGGRFRSTSVGRVYRRSPSQSGPIWFQSMDRNQDGDVSWGEFLGTREDFARLDLDRDDLIDAVEAARR